MAEKYPYEDGPFLSTALICEKVLMEQDGVKSAIRIIDRVTRQPSGKEGPTEMEPFTYQCMLFLRFKSGRCRGTRTIKIELVKPSGESKPLIKQSVLFEGEDDRGIDSVGQLVVEFDQTGVYWFNVLLEDIRVTKIPFRVIYSPQPLQ